MKGGPTTPHEGSVGDHSVRSLSSIVGHFASPDGGLGSAFFTKLCAMVHDKAFVLDAVRSPDNLPHRILRLAG